MVRQLRIGKDRFSFNLHALNGQESQKPVMYNMELMFAAAVMWVRYPQKKVEVCGIDTSKNSL